MGVTIKQIAEMAGVHRSTVDKVLHGRPGVSDPVRARVQKIIDECNYEANPIGKALQMQDKELRIKVLLLEVDALIYLKKGIHTKEQTQVIRRNMRILCENVPDLAGIFITCGGVKAVGDVLEEYEKEKIKVICYENYPEILELMSRDVVTATLDSEIEAQGRKAISVLMDKLIYNKKPPRKHLYSEIKILLKESF